MGRDTIQLSKQWKLLMIDAPAIWSGRKGDAGRFVNTTGMVQVVYSYLMKSGLLCATETSRPKRIVSRRFIAQGAWIFGQ